MDININFRFYESDVSSIEADISTIQSDISTIQSDVNKNETDILALSGDVSVLRTDVSKNKTDISTLKTDVGILKTDVGTLKTDVGNNKSDISTLNTNVGTLKTDVGILKTDVGTLKTDVSNKQNKNDSGLMTKSKIVVGAINELDGLLNTLNNDFTDFAESVRRDIGSMNFGPSLEDQGNISAAIASLGNVVGDMDNGDMDADFMGNHSILSYLKFMDTVLNVRELEHIIMETEDTIASILYNNLTKVKSLDTLVGAGNWGNNFIDGDNLSACVEELSRYLGYADDWTTQSKYTTVYNAIDSITNSISSQSSRIDNLENDCGASDVELKGLTTGQAFDYLINKINDLHALLK